MPVTESTRAVRVSGPLVAALFLLAVVLALSIALGARQLAVAELWPGLTDPQVPAYAVVHGIRLPRTLLGLLAGTALGLGARPARARAGAIAAVTLLCGVATAACGPIVFVGLMVPHMGRPLTGPDLRRMLPYCALFAPTLLLGADVLGRLVARPGEVQVGIVTAVLGGPFFLHVVRRDRWARA